MSFDGSLVVTFDMPRTVRSGWQFWRWHILAVQLAPALENLMARTTCILALQHSKTEFRTRTLNNGTPYDRTGSKINYKS
ncbi:unnamed protein product, partial [Nesidiocoris tenuis]